MSNLIDRQRTRLVNTYLAELVRKTGNMIAAVNLPDGSITTVELDADILTKALKKLFEEKVFSGTQYAGMENEIAETYSDCVHIKSGKITDMGMGFIDALLANLTEKAIEQRGGK